MTARSMALLAAAWSTGVWAQADPAGPIPAAVTPAAGVPATVVDPALRFASVENRMTVPVSIAGRGPWRFVIDTGAERSVVSRELAERLGLAAGPPIRVIDMAVAKVVPTAIVPDLAVSTVKPAAVIAPALEEVDLGAPGMLGIDALQGHRVDIDFDRAQITLHPSRRRRVVAPSAQNDEVVVVAKSVFGQLIVTDATWRGRRIAVVLDTGSSMTVGNLALQRLMAKYARRLGGVTAHTATGATMATEAYTVGELRLGGIGIHEMPVAFADAEPFRRFRLERRPAIMLGMDALRLFRRVRIDFANRAIEFTLPRNLIQPAAS